MAEKHVPMRKMQFARFIKSFSLVAFLAAAGACGPAARNDQVDADVGPTTDASDGNTGIFSQLTGKVYAPNQGPGQAAPGQEIPIYGAIVYISATRPDPMPQQTYCEKCIDTPSGGTLTAHDGSFTLATLPGTYWLVIQKGQFRLEQQITVGVGSLALTPAQTTLPSKLDPANGAWIPKIAIVKGSSDRIQDVMGKLGFGTMSGDTWAGPTGENGNEMVMYEYGATGINKAINLFNNIDEMRKYHIIFFPCQAGMGSEYDTLLRDQTKLANIRQYVKEGGKIYVTDWSGEVADRTFPHQVELGDSGADSEGTYDPIALTGNLTTVGDSDGGLYDSMDGQADDPDLRQWLGLQSGPLETGGVGQYNPMAFPVTDNWNFVKKLNTVLLGNDETGQPVYDEPKSWVSGSNGDGTGKHPQAVTYTPTGCGKVLFSTFQTASSAHAGLYPQERVLLYLIMEIQQCSETPVIE